MSILNSFGESKLGRILAETGRFPPVTIKIQPISGPNELRERTQRRLLPRKPFTLPINPSGSLGAANGFITYEFDQSILIPVDAFSFTYQAPKKDIFGVVDQSAYDYIKDGDLITLFANNIQIATGRVDTVQIEGDATSGERVTITGRDLAGQLEDQNALDKNALPLWGNSQTLKAVAESLINGTLIPGVTTTSQTPTASLTFATDPMETKLSALLRMIEPFNCVMYMSPSGRLTITKPNFGTSNPSRGEFVVSPANKSSNVLQYRVTRAATQIPNYFTVGWSGMEVALANSKVIEPVLNDNPRPKDLRSAGLRVIRAFTVSAAEAPELKMDGVAETGNSLLRLYANREIARQNVNELQVELVVPGHYDRDGNPYKSDTIFKINIERASVNEEMYLYGVKYRFSEDQGQTTILSFCKKNTIVAGGSTK